MRNSKEDLQTQLNEVRSAIDANGVALEKISPERRQLLINIQKMQERLSQLDRERMKLISEYAKFTAQRTQLDISLKAEEIKDAVRSTIVNVANKILKQAGSDLQVDEKQVLFLASQEPPSIQGVCSLPFNPPQKNTSNSVLNSTKLADSFALMDRIKDELSEIGFKLESRNRGYHSTSTGCNYLEHTFSIDQAVAKTLIQQHSDTANQASSSSSMRGPTPH